MLTVWLAVGSAALHTDRRTARGLILVGSLAAAGSVLNFAPASRNVLGVLSACAVGALPPLVGDALRRQRELLTEIQALRVRELEQAVAQERLAIARDVHDSVGHYLSAIQLQAGAAIIAGSDEPSSAAFDRTSVTLGILRRETAQTSIPLRSSPDSKRSWSPATRQAWTSRSRCSAVSTRSQDRPRPRPTGSRRRR